MRLLDAIQVNIKGIKVNTDHQNEPNTAPKSRQDLEDMAFLAGHTFQ